MTHGGAACCCCRLRPAGWEALMNRYFDRVCFEAVYLALPFLSLGWLLGFVVLKLEFSERTLVASFCKRAWFHRVCGEIRDTVFLLPGLGRRWTAPANVENTRRGVVSSILRFPVKCAHTSVRGRRLQRVVPEPLEPLQGTDRCANKQTFRRRATVPHTRNTRTLAGRGTVRKMSPVL